MIDSAGSRASGEVPMTNAAYFARREEVELALAKAAASPKVRDIHLDLANRYAMLARDQHQAVELRTTA